MDSKKKSNAGAGTGKLGWAGFTFVLLMAWAPFRWSVLEQLYLITCGKLPFHIVALEPVWEEYFKWELNTFPHLFPEEPPVTYMEAKDYSWDNFYHATDGLTRPIVVRDLFKDSPAVKNWATKEWCEKHSNATVSQIAKKLSSGDDQTRSDFLIKEGSFGDLFNEIQAGGYGYTYGLDEMYEQHPEIAPDLDYGKLGKDFINCKRCRTLSAFMSSEGKGIAWHNDGSAANILTQISGRKEWSMIDPKYSLFVGPLSRGEKISAVGFGCRSSQEIFSRLPKIKFETRKGDAMLIPAWWWHLVDSYKTDGNNVVFMNTCRFWHSASTLRTDWVLELYQPFGVKNWLHPSMPDFALWIPGFRYVQESIREFSGTQPKWSDDQCFSSRLGGCRRLYKKRGWQINEGRY